MSLQARVGNVKFDNLNAVLTAADCTFDDVVDVTVFIVDAEAAIETIWKVLPGYQGDAPHPNQAGSHALKVAFCFAICFMSVVL